MAVRADFIFLVVVVVVAVVVFVVVSVGATEEDSIEGKPAFSLADLQRLFLWLRAFRLESTFSRLRMQAEAIRVSTFESGDIRKTITKRQQSKPSETVIVGGNNISEYT